MLKREWGVESNGKLPNLFISISKFNLYVTLTARALQSHDLLGEGMKLWITYIFFWPHKDNGGPPRMSDRPNGGATSKTAQTWKTIHTKHTLRHTNKANVEWWLQQPNDIRGPWGPKVSWHLSYRWGKTLINLTQETCPDRGSNPGPLRDKRACYHLLHSCGPILDLIWSNKNIRTRSVLIIIFNIIRLLI